MKDWIPRFTLLIALFCMAWLSGACQSEQVTPRPTGLTSRPSLTPSQAIIPGETDASLIQTPPASATSPLPASRVISVRNATELAVIRRVTNGMITGSPSYSMDGSLFLVPTAAGVYLHDAETLQQRAVIPVPAYPGGLAALSADNHLLAVERLGGVALYNGQDAILIKEFTVAPGNLAMDLAFSPDGKFLAAGFDNNSMVVWSLPGGEELASLPGSLLDFSPDSQLLVGVDSKSRQATMYSTASWAQVGEWHGEQAVFSPTGSLGILDDGAFRLYDPQNGQVQQAFNGFSPAFSPDGSQLALYNLSQVHLYDVASGTRLRTMEGEFAEIAEMRFSPDGQTLVASTIVEMCPGCLTTLGPLAIWRVADGSLVQAIDGFNFAPWLAFDRQGSTLAAIEPDRLQFFDPETGNQVHGTSVYGAGVLTLAFSPDGQLLATAGYPSDSTRVWQVKDGRLALQPDDQAGGMNHMIGNAAFSPDGSILAVGTDFWQLPQGKDWRELELATEQVHHSLAESVAFSPVDPLVALGIGEGFVDLWNLDTLQRAGPLADNEGRALSLSYSSDGTRLAAAVSFPEDAIQIWQFPEQNLLTTIAGEQFFRVVFSPDGKRLASLAATEHFRESWLQAGILQVWNSRDGELLIELDIDDASSLAFSPDGALLATGSYDGSLSLWQASDGLLLASFPAHFQPVTGLAFSPDGELLASGSEDGSTLLWGLPAQE